MAFTHSDAIEVRRVRGKGRGVFARRLIHEGEIIERVPVIVLPLDEGDNGTVLPAYCFTWSRDSVALALGYGSLFNHSYQPNARYDDRGDRTKIFSALRDIEPGEEITVNYNGEPDDPSPVGFPVTEQTRRGRPSRSANGKYQVSVRTGRQRHA